MPKLTQKQENFVQAYFRTGNQRQSYLEAYDAEKMSDNAVDREACLLLQHPKVAQRLSQLQSKAAEKCERTVESVDEMLANAYSWAHEDKNTAGAVSAAMGIAKLHGLIVEKREDVTKRPSRAVDTRVDQLLDAARTRRAGGSSGRATRVPEERTAVPTVSGSGTA